MNGILEQINVVGSGFVHFALPMLVQSSVLIVILLAVTLIIRKKVRAVFLYWMWMLLLVKLVLPVSLSVPISVGGLVGEKLETVSGAGIFEPDIVSEMRPPALSPKQGPAPTYSSDGAVVSADTIAEAGDTQSIPLSGDLLVAHRAVKAVTPMTWQGVVFIVWGAITVVLALLLVQRVGFVWGLIGQAREANGILTDAMEFCREKMGVRQKISLKMSPNATSPAVCGLFRPVILLPQNLGPELGMSQLRAVMMHELAHVRRGDLWVNLAQTLLQIVYFYNPLLWLANAVIRRIREKAVDEAVMVAMGERAEQYPETLLNVAKLAFGRPALSLRLIGVVENKKALKGRMKHMLERPVPKSAKIGIVGFVVITLFGVLLLPMAAAQRGTESSGDSAVYASSEAQKAKLQRMYEARVEQDKKNYTNQQLGEIEGLYVVSNQKRGTAEARQSLESLLVKYPNGTANRLGCAILYLAQMSSGEQRERYLKTAIEKHGDCMYGDGVQVGAYGRYQLAQYYRETGRNEEADALLAEMVSKYPEPVDHTGKLLAAQVEGGETGNRSQVADVTYIVTFKPKGGFQPKTAKEFLDEFNSRHPRGVGTHHFRTEIEGDKLVGHICVDGEAGRDAVVAMIEGSSKLDFLRSVKGTEAGLDKLYEMGQPSLGGDGEELSYDDGTSDGRKSIAGGGHAIVFEAEEGAVLKAVKIYGSRYGYPQPPAEDFHVWVCDEDFNVIKDFPFPYSKFERGEPVWVTLEVEETEVPERFAICVGFNPERTKGVYVHYDSSSSGHSFKGLPGGEMPELEEGDWMIRAVVAKGEEEKTTPGTGARRGGRMQELSRDDGSSDGKKSIAGSAHGVIFEAPADGCILKSVRIYGSRYGTAQAPKENFHMWVCDADKNIIKDIELPYSRFTRGNPKWVTLRTPDVELPEEFIIAAGFNPEQTKGVYVHYDSSVSGNSLTGLPGKDMEVFTDGEWMIRAVVRMPGDAGQDEGPTFKSLRRGLGEMMKGSSRIGLGRAETSGSRSDAEDFQEYIDRVKAGETVQLVGVYNEPLKVNKPMTLKADPENGFRIEVTANEPALIVDTKGKGDVTIEGITVKWQLASSEKSENPVAVLIKDSKCEFKDCTIEALGNAQRSPGGLRVTGFSDVTVDSCYFTGFEYVVQFMDGTKGTLQDSIIRDCGHQGVINYAGSTMNVLRNIITGSKFHAVRSTGGTLNVKDNLIIANANRGIYLGNRSCAGVISNNLIIDSGTGIGGFARTRVKIENNVIARSTYAGIGARSTCELTVAKNILADNVRGIAVFLEEGQSSHSLKIGANTFWENETDTETCEKGSGSLEQDPLFAGPENGDYSLKAGAVLDSGHGLKDTEVIKGLWEKYKELDR